MTVPQSEIPNIDHLHVFVDNSKLDSSAVTITSDSTNYYIYFTFTYHSPVLIDIQLTASTSILGLDPTLFYALIGLTGIIIAVIAASRKRKKPTSTP